MVELEILQASTGPCRRAALSALSTGHAQLLTEPVVTTPRVSIQAPRFGIRHLPNTFEAAPENATPCYPETRL